MASPSLHTSSHPPLLPNICQLTIPSHPPPPHTGKLTDDPDRNPTFWNWNIVYVKYCDGGFFSGDVLEPIIYEGKSPFFSLFSSFLLLFLLARPPFPKT